MIHDSVFFHCLFFLPSVHESAHTLQSPDPCNLKPLFHILSLYSTSFVDCEAGMRSPDSKGLHRRDSSGGETQVEGTGKPKRHAHRVMLQMLTGGLKKGAQIIRGGNGRRKQSRDWNCLNTDQKYGSLPSQNVFVPKSNMDNSEIQSRYSCDKTILRDNFTRKEELSPLFVVDERSVLERFQKVGEDDSVDHSVILAAERFLRYILISLGIYWLGMNHKLGSIHVVLHQAGEFLLIAWATCIIIIVIAKFIKKRSRSTGRTTLQTVYPVGQAQTQALDTEVAPDNRRKDQDYEVDLAQDSDDTEMDEIESSQPILHHPELDNLHLIDCTTYKRIMPNAGPVPIDNDYMYGVMVPMFRTSDADGPPSSLSDSFTTTQSAVSDYLRPKQRRFELQFQVKFKQIPEGNMFFSMHLYESIQLGLIQRAFVGATLNFIKKKNSNGFHYNLYGPEGRSEEDVASGKYEVPQLSFTVESCMDRVVVTKPGSNAPALGSDIYEDPEAIKRRKKGLMAIEYNTEDTYTFSLWSAYPDFVTWRVINLPAIRPFSLSAVFGDKPFKFIWYALKPSSDGFHYQRDIIPFMAVEFNHKVTRKGPAVERWIENNLAVDDEDAAYANDLSSLDEGLPIQEVDDDMEGSPSPDSNYLVSGMPIILRETDTGRSDVYLADGGGFATLQNHCGCFVVLEKVARHSQGEKKKTSAQVLKAGDVVRIKMMSSENSDESSGERYLSITRGRWLRWVRRSKAAFEIALDDSVQGSYHSDMNRFLKLGDSFQLKFRISPQYFVGAANVGSVSVGGRAVGLYKKHGDIDEDKAAFSDNDSVKMRKHELKPFVLCATCLPTLSGCPVTNNLQVEEPKQLNSSLAHSCIDVPAWIEMMHRAKRTKQRVYVVRVGEKNNSLAASIIRIRSGRSILPLLRLAMKIIYDSSDGHADLKQEQIRNSAVLRLLENDDDNLEGADQKSEEERSISSSIDDFPSLNAEFSETLPEDFTPDISALSPNDKGDGSPQTQRRRSWISASASNLGRPSKPVGPFKSQANLIKKTKPSLKVDGTLKFKSINQESSSDDHFPKAGKLSSADHSCMIMSRLFNRVTHITSYGSFSSERELAENVERLLNFPSKLDAWFLRGGCIELGINPSAHESGTPLSQQLVVRCIWESHWREEAVLLYKNCIAFYPPLTKKPCLSILLNEIDMIRTLPEISKYHPIPGFPTLCIETACRCHYLAFLDPEALESFSSLLRSQVAATIQIQGRMENEISNAFLLQKIQQMSDLAVVTEERKKWDTVTSQNKARQRVILNNRRVTFDTDGFEPDDSSSAEKAVGAFVQNLLSRALSFSLNELEESPESFIGFLDDTCRLRKIPLGQLDLSGNEAFCIFVNLYHCLLQHALLLSPIGPLSKRNINKFMRTICYEIGGDVFSLAELHTYIIRGNLSKCFYVKPPLPYVIASRRSWPYQAYALGHGDARINFLIQLGDSSIPRSTPVLKSESLDDQLNQYSQVFLKAQIMVDKSKNTIILPKVCDVYRNDFGAFGDPISCALYCANFLEPDIKSVVMQMIKNASTTGISILFKFRPSSGRFHDCLSN